MVLPLQKKNKIKMKQFNDMFSQARGESTQILWAVSHAFCFVFSCSHILISSCKLVKLIIAVRIQSREKTINSALGPRTTIIL